MGHQQQCRQNYNHGNQAVMLPACYGSSYSYDQVISQLAQKTQVNAVDNNAKAAPGVKSTEVFHYLDHVDASKPVYSQNACGQTFFMGNEVVRHYFKLDSSGSLKEWSKNSAGKHEWLAHNHQTIKPYYATEATKLDSCNAKIAISNSDGVVVGHVILNGSQIPVNPRCNVLTGYGQFVPTEAGKNVGLESSNYNGTSLQVGGNKNWGLVFIGKPPAVSPASSYDDQPATTYSPVTPIAPPVIRQRSTPAPAEVQEDPFEVIKPASPAPTPARPRTATPTSPVAEPDTIRPRKIAEANSTAPGQTPAESKPSGASLIRPTLPVQNVAQSKDLTGLELERARVMKAVLHNLAQNPTDHQLIKIIHHPGNVTNPSSAVPEQWEIRVPNKVEENKPLVFFVRPVVDSKTKQFGILFSEKAFSPFAKFKEIDQQFLTEEEKKAQVRQGVSMRTHELPSWIKEIPAIQDIKKTTWGKGSAALTALADLRNKYGIGDAETVLPSVEPSPRAEAEKQRPKPLSGPAITAPVQRRPAPPSNPIIIPPEDKPVPEKRPVPQEAPKIQPRIDPDAKVASS